MSVLTRSHVPTILLLSVFFGSNLVVSRFALGQFHPVTFVATRMPIAALLAVLWARLQYGSFPSGRRLWLHGSVVGIFATAAPMIFFVSALQYQSSGVTALFISLTPISAMVYAHFRMPDEPTTTRKALGALLSFAGVALLLVTGETGLGETNWEGFVLVLIGVASNGFGTSHVRKYLSGQRSLDIAAVRLTAAATATVPFAAVADGFDYSSVAWSGVLALVYGVLPGTLLAFSLYSFVVARFGATKGTQVEYLVPVVAALTGWVFLDERITIVMVVGMAVVFAGIAVATVRRRPGG
ncbi:MAG: DMT family transporter [Spirochaetota bacterium]